jgi:hypothetical protein
MFLHEWLDQNKIGEDVLAKFLKCSIFAVKKWVNGEREPRWDQREQIMVLTKDQVTPNDWHENRRAYEAWRAANTKRRQPKRSRRKKW